MNAKNVRHTITLNEASFAKLRTAGRFGETYSTLILRLITARETKESNQGGNTTA